MTTDGSPGFNRLRERVARLSDQGRTQLERVLSGRGLLAGSGRSPGGPHTRLVAHYATVDGAEADPTELRTTLQRMLPAYMVPSLFLHVDALPRTHRGKVDRASLQLVAGSMQGSARVDSASTSTEGVLGDLEEEVLGLWRDVLGFDRIELDDSFFEIGGDSLLGIQLLGKIRDRWQLDLSMEVLFDHPTVRDTAAHVSTVLWARDSGEGGEKGASTEEIEEVEF